MGAGLDGGHPQRDVHGHTSAGGAARAEGPWARGCDSGNTPPRRGVARVEASVGVRPMPSTPNPPFTVGLVVPSAGSEGMYGPSCVLCARLAVEELNATGGVLGRPVHLRILDGSGPPAQVAAAVGQAARTGVIDAVVGWHLSPVRVRLATALRGVVPYVFTALYEGGETTPGVVPIGETPDIQVTPALRWMADEIGVRRWAVVGNDYRWPRRSLDRARAALGAPGGPTLEHERFVPLGTTDHGAVLDDLADLDVDGVLTLLVGSDAVAFHREFARRGMEDRFARFSPLMDESMLCATGPGAVRDVFTAAGWFEAVPTAESLAFGARYARRFGPGARPSAPGESCYEGVGVLAALVNRVGCTDPVRLSEAAADCRYVGPRGPVTVRDGRTEQRIYLAVADGSDFDVLASL